MREWSTLRKLMLLKGATGAPLNEYTATGNPLTFNTNKAKPLPSVLASWLPHQQGSGDPSPENIRPVVGLDGVTVGHSGINVFDGVLENGYLDTTTGKNAGTSNIRSKNYISVLPNTNYMASFIPTGEGASNMRVFYYDKDKSFMNTTRWAKGNVTVLTIPSDCYFIRFYMDGAYTSGTDRDIAINYPSTETDYSPYHGTSYSVAFPVLGKNLLDPSNRTANGNNVRYYRSEKDFLLKGGQTYTLTASVTSDQLSIFDSNNTSLASTYSQSLTYTPTEDVSVWFDLYVANAHLPEGGIDAVYGMLELGDTAHSYEPYTRTCYGGTLDLTTGVLTAEWATKLFDGSIDEKWYFVQVGSSAWYRAYINMTDAKQSNSVPVFANSYKAVSFNDRSFSSKVCFMGNESETPQIFAIITDVTSLENFRAYLTENPLTISYKLAEPQTYQLSPTQITALIGNNTMWADADELSVTYLKKG